jgi:hypothetical protein
MASNNLDSRRKNPGMTMTGFHLSLSPAGIVTRRVMGIGSANPARAGSEEWLNSSIISKDVIAKQSIDRIRYGNFSLGI